MQAKQKLPFKYKTSDIKSLPFGYRARYGKTCKENRKKKFLITFKFT